MPDTTGTPTKSDGGNDNINNSTDKGDNASDAKKTKSTESTFDPKQIGDEDFEKVFDDPRLFQHSRFKELNERAKRAAELEKQQEKAEKAKLKEQQKWQELAEKTEAEKAEIEQKYQKTLVDMKIQSVAAQLGAVDSEAVAKLIDRDAIDINDDGSVTGVDEAVKALQESKSYLFGEKAPTKLGNATNPGSDGNKTGRKFTLSQIQDPTFYKENEKDILQAFAQGNIENDM